MIMRRGMGSPGCLATVSDSLSRQLDWFDGLVDARDGALAGHFGRADITAASLLYPLAGVSSTPTRLRLNYSEAVMAQLAVWQRRPSLRWVRRTYESNRGATLP
jgi:glutathione S-transferase